MTSAFVRIKHLIVVPEDTPELLCAKCTELSRFIPLLYSILVANSWVLAFSFIDSAPAGMTFAIAISLSAICAVRTISWWRNRHVVLTPDTALHEARRTNRLTALLTVAFLAWAMMLFPHGNTYTQSHVIFFLAISLISTMFCLIHLPSAALIVAGIMAVFFTGFLAVIDVLTLKAMAVNILLVLVAAVIIILIQSRNFARMINAQAELRRQMREQGKLLHMLDDMPVAAMTVELDTFNINYANATSISLIRSIEHLLPIKAENLIGTSIDIFHRQPEYQRRLLADPANLPHSARIRLGPEILELQVCAIRDDDGRYIAPMLTWAIITKEVEAENQILQLAHYDPLTRFSNRNRFYEMLTEGLQAPGSRVGILFIDLDGFKLVNDSKGHRIGDILLRQVADRFRLRTASHGGCKTIGRLGGDEFAVLMEHNDPRQAEELADSLIEIITAPFHLEDDADVNIGASIGIALAPQHGTTAELLLARADIALYAAKSAGKCTFKMFSVEMEQRIQEHTYLELSLRMALEHYENLFVFYQPIIDIETGQVTTREALVRWYHPQRGWIPPSEFIPVAEQIGLIGRLSYFVINHACSDASDWEEQVGVAVNISASLIGKGFLVDIIRSALLASGLPPSRLELEVTETALLNHAEEGIEELRQLRDMGVRIALDDFGTGYSSLAHLRIFPFDKIKIDGSFVKDAVTRPDCAAVVKAIADLGKRLNVVTVAEGVETAEQLELVRAEGCMAVQGYLYGYPMPTEEYAAQVERLNRQ
ncbi:EAL domain-containing protein [Methylobacillus flagellatus]|uniref:putative bifunctional diguanylate cyclase/phosphodiesterase n=1 Tax=Methylobacillus flagellatus TaxID=405 RepID=UPI002853B45A|nr:EAL domain-containing protein [Methylobacillus flagellatus]MDR5172216.1 EAL domain-containing protein [Methylobacillus flagellatus]